MTDETSEPTTEITAQQVIDAAMVPELRAMNEKMKLALRDLEYMNSALSDVARFNVAASLLPYYLEQCEGDTEEAVVCARGLADDFVDMLKEDMEVKASDYARKVLEQEDADALLDDTTDGTVQ